MSQIPHPTQTLNDSSDFCQHAYAHVYVMSEKECQSSSHVRKRGPFLCHVKKREILCRHFLATSIVNRK